MHTTLKISKCMVKLPLQQLQDSLDIDLQQKQHSWDNHEQSLLFHLQKYREKEIYEEHAL